MNFNYVVYQIMNDSDIDDALSERWRRVEFARFNTEKEAWACVDSCNDYCEIEMELKWNWYAKYLR